MHCFTYSANNTMWDISLLLSHGKYATVIFCLFKDQAHLSASHISLFKDMLWQCITMYKTFGRQDYQNDKVLVKWRLQGNWIMPYESKQKYLSNHSETIISLYLLLDSIHGNNMHWQSFIYQLF